MDVWAGLRAPDSSMSQIHHPRNQVARNLQIASSCTSSVLHLMLPRRRACQIDDTIHAAIGTSMTPVHTVCMSIGPKKCR